MLERPIDELQGGIRGRRPCWTRAALHVASSCSSSARPCFPYRQFMGRSPCFTHRQPASFTDLK